MDSLVLFVKAGDTVDIPNLGLLLKQGETAAITCNNIDRHSADIYLTTTVYDPRKEFNTEFIRQLENELMQK